MYSKYWKHAILAGGFAIFALSGSSSSEAAGRVYDPSLPPFVFQADYLTKWNACIQFGPPVPLQPPTEEVRPAADAQPASESAAPAAQAAQPVASAKSASSAGKAQPKADAAKKSAAPKPKAAPAAAEKSAAAPKAASGKTMTMVASAYTGAASENGGYASLDYFGNPLKVGTIAVDPKVIPLGSTVYVTGYRYDGLPEGGMVAKATDVGGAIRGNRIDIYVPGTPEQARKFAFQTVKVQVVD